MLYKNHLKYFILKYRKINIVINQKLALVDYCKSKNFSSF